MTSDSAPTPQDQFRQHLAQVLSDLRNKVEEDGEIVALIGSLASELSAKLSKARWSDAKDAMSTANYDELLQSFQTRGNALHQSGEHKKAYAIQALSTSLVATTMRSDQAIAEGEGLLDALIDRAIVLFDRQKN